MTEDPLDLFDAAIERQDAGIPDYDYRVRTAYDAMQPQPPIEWIVKDLIPRGTVTVMYGEPGSLKTWAMIALCVSVALGQEWLDFETTQAKTLYIDEESGETWFSRRLQMALKGQFGDESTPVEFVCNAGLMLDDKNDGAELERLITHSGAGLVVLDALADLMGGDENSKSDVQPILTRLKKIADKTQASIVLIHHSAKHGGYRGSSAIKGAADLLVKIESKDDSDFMNFKSEKVRHIEFIKFTGKATWSEEQFYLTRAEEKDEVIRQRPRSEKYVLKYLRQHGASPTKDIMDNADMCSPNAARSAIYRLVDEGKVYRTDSGETGRGHMAIYDLTQQEDEEEDDEKWHDK